jgi:hypothetical protein
VPSGTSATACSSETWHRHFFLHLALHERLIRESLSMREG